MRFCDCAIVRVCVCVCACVHVTKKHEKRDLVLFPLPEGATGTARYMDYVRAKDYSRYLYGSWFPSRLGST